MLLVDLLQMPHYFRESFCVGFHCSLSVWRRRINRLPVFFGDVGLPGYPGLPPPPQQTHTHTKKKNNPANKKRHFYKKKKNPEENKTPPSYYNFFISFLFFFF